MSADAFVAIALLAACTLGFLFGYVAGVHTSATPPDPEPLRGVPEPPSNVRFVVPPFDQDGEP